MQTSTKYRWRSEQINRRKLYPRAEDKENHHGSESAHEQGTRSQNFEEDRLRPTLDKLEEGLGELKIWSLVMKEVTSNRELMTSQPLAALLERIREAFSMYFSSFDYLFTEVRRRLKMDWILSNLQAKKVMSDDLSRQKIAQLQSELNEEIRQSHEFETNLQEIKDSLSNTHSIFWGEKMSGNSQRALVAPSSSSSLVVASSKVSHRKDSREVELGDEGAGEGDSSDSHDDSEEEEGDDGEDGDEEDRTGHSGQEAEEQAEEQFGNEGAMDEDNENDQTKIEANRFLAAQRAKLAKRRAKLTLTSQPKVKFRNLQTGERIVDEVVNNALYYQFTMVGAFNNRLYFPAILNLTSFLASTSTCPNDVRNLFAGCSTTNFFFCIFLLLLLWLGSR